MRKDYAITATDFTIRDATPGDVDALLRMHAQSWLDTYPNEKYGISRQWVQERTDQWFSEDNIRKREQRIHEAATNPDILFKLAVNEEGRVIGFISPFRDESVQRVGAIYVDKQYHGKGVARVLMKEILAWVDPTRPLTLEVASYNERAKAFYRKYGFVEQPGSEHIIKERIPVMTMTRKGGAI